VGGGWGGGEKAGVGGGRRMDKGEEREVGERTVDGEESRREGGGGGLGQELWGGVDGVGREDGAQSGGGR